MRASRTSTSGLAALILLAVPSGNAIAADVEKYESIGHLKCEPERSWRWWTPVFSRSYFKCDFQRHDGVKETYRGRTGMKPGIDLQPDNLLFEVFVQNKTPQKEVAPYQLEGQYTGVKKTPSRDESVALTLGDFRIQPLFTGIAVGRVYLQLEPKPVPNDN